MSKSYSCVNGFVEHETDAAILLIVDGEEKWIPRSVILDGDDVGIGFEGEIYLKPWFYKQEFE